MIGDLEARWHTQHRVSSHFARSMIDDPDPRFFRRDLVLAEMTGLLIVILLVMAGILMDPHDGQAKSDSILFSGISDSPATITLLSPI